jgi:hypothetical protein
LNQLWFQGVLTYFANDVSRIKLAMNLDFICHMPFPLLEWIMIPGSMDFARSWAFVSCTSVSCSLA